MNEEQDKPTDLYALYLRAYLATMTGGAVPMYDGCPTPQMQAIALGIEDGAEHKAGCAGVTIGEDPIGYRSRYDVLQTISDSEASEPPDGEDE